MLQTGMTTEMRLVMSFRFFFFNLSSVLTTKEQGINTMKQSFINLLCPTSDLDRICPYIISMISSRQVMRVKKNIN